MESLSLISSDNFIMNNVPGYWSGDGEFSVIQSLVYNTASQSSCTTTVTVEMIITSVTDTPILYRN